ncbi:MAG TPA: hydroxysqualene dehydroxylase HpnE [Xanthobacteraceae bacterium]|nr:hydroxysqualene dehydroxylase HpnE [Xanthobacteraceae bacterium]
MPPRTHIIGAGLSGLAAAVRLAARGRDVTVYEATSQAGGRCRSYHDPALDMVIDNGNHLVLSGNEAVMSFVDMLGARGHLRGPATASFPFIDLANSERWTLEANEGPIAWWIFDPRRRVPGTGVFDYLSILKLMRAPPGASIGDVIECKGPLYERLLSPLLLAALNTEPPQGSAALAAAIVRETLMAGGSKYHPLIAHDGLSVAFIDPAVNFIGSKGGNVLFGQRLKSLEFDGRRVAALDFGENAVALDLDDPVVLAVPPVVATSLVPELHAPTEFRAIVNAHYKLDQPSNAAPITGVINGTVEWLFAFPDRLSVTISAGDRFLDTPREELAAKIWQDVVKIADVAPEMPPWQIVRERRATFAALPHQDAIRPPTRTQWRNLLLAGDWTATGLPATIEGAIRSGFKAADMIGEEGNVRNI